MSSFLGRKELSRGIRNNNPGNIRFSGSNNWLGKIAFSQNTDSNKSFEQFTEMSYGIRAMLVLVNNYINSGHNTIQKVINKYAPPVENNTKKYIDYVALKTGIDKDVVLTDLDYTFLLSVSRAIIDYENGKDSKLVYDSDIDKAIELFMANLTKNNLSGVTITAKKKFKFNYLIIPVLLFFYTVFSVTV